MDFVRKSLALSPEGLAGVAQTLSVGAASIWAVLEVETSGCGFLEDRRPTILYERHIFHRLTGGRFDDGDISSPVSGGYGMAGSHQYDRLNRAFALDPKAALQSASWGLGQIMGENFRDAGFGAVEDMVAAMCDSEDAQLAAVAAFISARGFASALLAQDWATFARGYNGPGFAKNQYDIRLRGEFQKFSHGAMPDLRARTVQLYLRYRGFSPGPVDGVPGHLTRDAISQFQQQHGLPVSGEIDDELVALLAPQPPATPA
jgi:N-acetylmuramidase/Putative peptidoglycan binding domain